MVTDKSSFVSWELLTALAISATPLSDIALLYQKNFFLGILTMIFENL